MKIQQISIFLAAVALLGGCKDVSVPQERPAADIGGVAADNIIRNGNVRVYAWDGREKEVLMTTTTDQYGVYNDPLQAGDQFIKVCITGGEYTEESSGMNIRLENGDRICAVTFWQSGIAQDVMVTPETNLATAYAECQVKKGGSNLQNIVSDANTRIGTLFGYNILTTMPADMTSDNLQFTGLNDSIRSGLWHAAFSRVALNAAKANGLSSHTQLISSIKLHQLLYKDVASDCKLDGYGLADNGQTRIPLSMGSYNLNADIYRAGLARELVSFISSPRNKTAVKTNDVLSYATAYSLSTDTIFPDDKPPVAFDDQGPVISWPVDNGTYIAGFYPVSLAVTDFSGISSIDIAVNGEQPSELDISNPVTTINTSRFQDGPIAVVIRATDKLNNVSTITKNLNVINSSPVVNMTSKTLVNAADYLWSGTISDFPQGIVSASLNGKPATISEGIITAPATLSQGVNTLALSLVDGAGATHSYQWSVDMDRVSPLIEYRMGEWLTTLKNVATEETFTAYMKPSFGSNESIYVTPSKFSLRGMAVTDNALAATNWPALRLEIGDFAAGTNTYFSDVSNLKIEMHYLDRSSEVFHFSRPIPSTSTGIVLIPLSSEFLGPNWWEKPGANRIRVVVTDEAGNTATMNWDVPVSVSNPRLDFPIGDGDYIAGNQVLNIGGTDLTGIDYVSVALNGGTPVNLTPDNLQYTFDTASLPDGLHYFVVDVVSDGSVVTSNTYEFTVDNTSPALSVDTAVLVNRASYRLAGSASDSGSGLASVTSNGSPLSLGSFEKAYTLTGGKNNFAVVATDAAGNSTSVNHQVIFDQYLPVFGSASSTDSLALVRYGKTHAPTTNWLSFSKDNEPFYIDEPIVTLNGLDLTDPLTEAQLVNNKYPFFRVFISDTNDPSGDLVSNTELSLYMTVRFGSETIVDMKKLNPMTPSGGFLVPVVTELFSERLREVASTTLITVIFTAEDKAGNRSTQQHQFKVFVLPPDSVAPTITVNLNDNYWSNSNITLNVSATDEVGISQVSLKSGMAQVPGQVWNLKGDKSFSHSRSFSAEGKYKETYDVIDLAGNKRTFQRNFNIDRTAPTVAINKTAPATIVSKYTLSWSANDNFGIEKQVLTVNGQSRTLTSSDRSFTFSGSQYCAGNSCIPWAVKEGLNDVSLTVFDYAGNKKTDTFQLNYHVTAPTVRSNTGNSFSLGTAGFTILEIKASSSYNCFGGTVYDKTSTVMWQDETTFGLTGNYASYLVKLKDTKGLVFWVGSGRGDGMWCSGNVSAWSYIDAAPFL